jgi:hypothetical protein
MSSSVFFETPSLNLKQITYEDGLYGGGISSILGGEERGRSRAVMSGL